MFANDDKTNLSMLQTTSKHDLLLKQMVGELANKSFTNERPYTSRSKSPAYSSRYLEEKQKVTQQHQEVFFQAV